LPAATAALTSSNWASTADCDFAASIFMAPVSI
jgi:hypothetical protein